MIRKMCLLFIHILALVYVIVLFLFGSGQCGLHENFESSCKMTAFRDETSNLLLTYYAAKVCKNKLSYERFIQLVSFANNKTKYHIENKTKQTQVA